MYRRKTHLKKLLEHIKIRYVFANFFQGILPISNLKYMRDISFFIIFILNIVNILTLNVNIKKKNTSRKFF